MIRFFLIQLMTVLLFTASTAAMAQSTQTQIETSLSENTLSQPLALTKQDKALAKIHRNIIKDHPALPHVSAAQIAAQISVKINRPFFGQDDVLLLDVREAKEYAVSHISGALRVDPDISEDEFLALYGDQLAGKNVVLYCSVGRRSSSLGDKLRTPILARGAAKVSNLEGGIFGWHNEALPLVSSLEATDKVHPYNAWWGRLITRKDGIAYKAAKTSQP